MAGSGALGSQTAILVEDDDLGDGWPVLNELPRLGFRFSFDLLLRERKLTIIRHLHDWRLLLMGFGHRYVVHGVELFGIFVQQQRLFLLLEGLVISRGHDRIALERAQGKITTPVLLARVS